MLFGQGYSTNALQLTNAIAVVANKGVMKPQSIIKSVTASNGREEKVNPGESKRVVDESVANELLNAMESVAEHYQKFAGVSTPCDSPGRCREEGWPMPNFDRYS